MKLAFLFILYFTINTLFYFFLKLYHQNYERIFIFIAFCAFYMHPHTLTGEISTLVKQEVSSVSALPFLDWYVYLSPTEALSLDDTKYVENNRRDIRRYADEGHDVVCVNHDLAVAGLCNCDDECGYEGDNEDNGDYEDDDFNKIIEEFIAVKKREWREEMITESLLCIEAANL